MTVAYLVSAVHDAGVKEAIANGWTQIAFSRFVTPEKHDIRLVNRASELIPMAAKTPMFRGKDYEKGPPGEPEDRTVMLWAKERASIDRFVAEGNGEWVESL